MRIIRFSVRSDADPSAILTNVSAQNGIVDASNRFQSQPVVLLLLGDCDLTMRLYQ